MTTIVAKKRSFFNEDLDDLLEIKKYKYIDNSFESSKNNIININDISKNMNDISKNIDDIKNEFAKFNANIIDIINKIDIKINKIDAKINNLQNQINEIIYIPPPKFNNNCSYIN